MTLRNYPLQWLRKRARQCPTDAILFASRACLSAGLASWLDKERLNRYIVQSTSMVSCINIGSRTYSAEGLKSPNVLEPDSVATHLGSYTCNHRV